MRNFSYVLAIVFVIISILDVISTNMGLAAGATEANPIMAFIQELLGIYWFIPKILLVSIAVYLIICHPSVPVLVIMTCVIAFTILIVYSNFQLSGVV